MRNSRFILVPNALVFDYEVDYGRLVNDFVYLSPRSLTNKHACVTIVFIKIVIKGDRPGTDPARR